MMRLPKCVNSTNNLYVYLNCEKKITKKQCTIWCEGRVDFERVAGQLYEKLDSLAAAAAGVDSTLHVFVFDNDTALSCGEKYVRLNDVVSCWCDFRRDKKITIYHLHVVERSR